MKNSNLKILILLVIGAFSNADLSAQISKKEKKKKGKSAFIEQLAVQVFSSEVYIDLAGDRLFPPKASIGKGNTFDARVQKEESTIKPLQINLRGGELVIKFEEPPIVEEQYNLRTIEVRLGGQTLSLPPERIEEKSGTLHWYGLAEQYPNLVGDLAVDINVATWGTQELPYGVHCEDGEPSPLFTSKPYWITGGVGLVALGAGRLLRESSANIYEKYTTADPPLTDEIQGYYDTANKKRKQYLALTYVGGTLILADVILLIIRENRHKKRVDTYQKFCNKPSVSWQPMVDFSSTGIAATQIGFTTKFIF